MVFSSGPGVAPIASVTVHASLPVATYLPFGEKAIATEFIAYTHLNAIKDTLSPQAVLISTYALCGFANFASIAIQIGGIGGLAPNRRADIARLGLRALLGGTLATMMTATIAGVLTNLS